MDAAMKAEREGENLGLGGYCHGLFFSLTLSVATRRANSIATLELMALPCCCCCNLSRLESLRHFPRVVLESDSLSASFHLADDKAMEDAAQCALEYLHAMPAFLSTKPRLH
eukprot:2938930-Pleurochrysis_carterae.AAC.2